MYLLDTNIVSAAVDPFSPKHSAVQRFLQSNALFKDQIHICVVTVAETRFGLNVFRMRKPAPSADRIQQVEQRVTKIAEMSVLPIDNHVARCHAELRAAYAHHKVPKLAAGQGLKNKAVELWHESVPPSKLHISENDLWITAAAINYELILVSSDQDHKELREIYPKFHLLSI